jgi:hypothetical protein
MGHGCYSESQLVRKEHAKGEKEKVGEVAGIITTQSKLPNN